MHFRIGKHDKRVTLDVAAARTADPKALAVAVINANRPKRCGGSLCV